MISELLYLTLIIVFLFFTILTLIKIEIVIIFLIIIRPFVEFTHSINLGSIAGYEINPMSAWAAILIILNIFYWVIKKRNPFLYKITKWILLFIFSVCLGAIFSTGLVAVIQQILKILPWLLLIPVVADMTQYYDYRKIFKWIYQMTVFFLLINVLLFITGKYNTGYYGVGEFYSLYKGPHSFAFTVLFLTPFIFYQARMNRKSKLPWIFLFLSLLFMFSSYVRTSIAASIIGFWVLLALEKGFKHRMVTILGVASFVFILFLQFSDIIGAALPIRMRDFTEAFETGKVGALGSGRFTMWSVQLNYYINGSLKGILFGYGVGFASIVSLKQIGVALGSHSDYIDLLLGTGLISCLFYIFFQYKLYRTFRTLNENEYLLSRLAIIVLTMYVVVALFNGILYAQSNIYNALLFGTVIGQSYKKLRLQSHFKHSVTPKTSHSV